MPTLKQTIEERLLRAQIAITNALDAEVQPLLAVYGYDATRIGEGQGLYDSAQQLHNQQTREYAEQFAATDELQTKWDAAKADYIRFLKIARIALKNDRSAAQKLDLDGRRKVTLSGWLGQTRQFYTNILADAAILAKMAAFGITQEMLTAGKALVDETETANAAQEKEKGEAQQATKDRDSALEILDEWLSDFIAIARIALEGRPQLLEKLGIVQPS